MEPGRFAGWSAQVARNDRFGARALASDALPPIKHVVFIVHENKHFDEEFADVPGTNADPSLLLFGRKYTPDAHALGQGYAILEKALPPAAMDFDWFRDFGTLGGAPRMNVSGVFGPRGQLIDELARKHVSFRVYGEQLTMPPPPRSSPRSPSSRS